MRVNKVLISFLVLGLILWVVIRLLHFSGLYGQDGYEYLRYAQELHAHPLSATPSPYFPPLYSALGALLGCILDITTALQLISVFSFVLALWVAYEISRLISPASRYAHIFLLLFGFLSPYYMRSAVCVMSDSLATLFLVCTVFYAISFSHRAGIHHFLLTLFFSVLCVLTRFAALIPLSAILLLLIVGVLRRGDSKLLLKMGGLLSLSVLLGFCFGKGIFLKGSGHLLLNGFSFFNLFHSSFSSSDGQAIYSLPNIFQLLSPFAHPGFIFIGAVLLIVGYTGNILTQPEVVLCLAPALAYLLFLGMLPVQNVRLEILVFPLILVVYQPAFEKMIIGIEQKSFLFIGTSICQITLIVFSMKAILQMSRTENRIAEYLRPLQNKYHYIYELGGTGLVRSAGIDIMPLSIYGDTLFSVKDSSLLLLQAEGFEKQWQGKLPERNFEFIKAHTSIEELKKFGNKWNLYILHHRQ